LIIFEIVGVVINKTLGIDATRANVPLPANYSNTQELGALLYSQYAYPFEIAAVLLLVAIVAAIALTLRHRVGLKVQDIGKQVSARAKDRVRLVKMGSEARK
jgi:NADH-quinone oxidoreductase subunit J